MVAVHAVAPCGHTMCGKSDAPVVSERARKTPRLRSLDIERRMWARMVSRSRTSARRPLRPLISRSGSYLLHSRARVVWLGHLPDLSHVDLGPAYGSPVTDGPHDRAVCPSSGRRLGRTPRLARSTRVSWVPCRLAGRGYAPLMLLLVPFVLTTGSLLVSIADSSNFSQSLGSAQDRHQGGRGAATSR